MEFDKVSKEHILKAIKDFEDKGYPSEFGPSSTYDINYNGKKYPPKAIMAYANYHATGQKISRYFKGGLKTDCFKALERNGFKIVTKSKIEFDQKLFDKHFKEYVSYCGRSQWLKYREAYKFRFARWLNDKVDFNTQKDEEILAICIDSQKQEFDEGSKGVNFIVSTRRFHDEVISLIDIQNLRKLGERKNLNENVLKDSPLTFPKFSVWAGTLFPEHQKIFANEELTIGIAYLFNLNKYPKSGIKAFNLANKCMNNVANYAITNFNNDLQDLIKLVFPETTKLLPVDVVWLMQDFILYLNRRVLDYRPNYYWVNQGDNFKAELRYGIVAAPNHKLHHHKRLKDLLEGDIIIHYANSAIRSTSKVTNEFTVKPRPYIDQGNDDLIVKVQYQELETPIIIEKVKSKFINKKGILPKKYGPFTKDLSVVQMYMCAFNDVSFKELFDINNYWVFQGNPKVYDFETALRKDLIDNWTVNAHKDKIKVGDKVILYITGKNAGCYALAEVTSNSHSKTPSKDDHLWIEENNSELKASLIITHNLVDKPILKELIDIEPKLNKLNVGHQGTNFSATKEEFDTILEMINNKVNRKFWIYAPGDNASKWEEFQQKGIMALGWDDLGDLKRLGDRDSITKAIQTTYDTKSKSYNNALANFEFRDIISIGDVIIPKKGRKEYLGYGIVTSDYYFDKTRKEYKHCRKVDWKKSGLWKEPKGDIVLKTLTDITKYPEYVKELIKLIGIEQIENLNHNIMEESKPLNSILYGPPGTGKTYKLKTHYFPKYTSKETSITKEKNFENVVKECTWFEVITIALLEIGEKAKVSDIFKNRWVLKKAELSNSSNVRPTLWGQLQVHTIDNCEFVNYKNRQNPQIFNKTTDSYWEIIHEELEEQAPEIKEITDKVNNYKPKADKEIKRYTFTTFHQSFGYEDFIEGIKPVMGEYMEESSDLKYTIESGVFKQICEDAERDPENKYAIFIDEINRGNVSSIFGELITLIEPDKRKGSTNEMSALLPYSKKEFSVPSNLDIYGTMNTADRSVEALDTALRRRFSFEEMMPDASLIKTEIDGISLSEVLTTINERIEVLVDRDHTIGHSYLMDVDSKESLSLAFKDKIIPLLQEYFYGDYGKIGLVLGGGFVKKQKKKQDLFSKFNYEGKEELNQDYYELVKIDESFPIIDALKSLLPETDNKEN